MPPLSDFISLKYSAGGPPVTRHFSQYLGAFFAYALGRLGTHPNAVTLLSLALFLAGCACLVKGSSTYVEALIALAVFQVSYGLDCADGQLARAMKKTSDLGAWLDNVCDLIGTQVLASCLLVMSLEGSHLAWTVTSTCIFAAGHVTLHYTATRIRIKTDQRIQTKGLFHAVRVIATTVTDKPVTLLILCLLMPMPVLVPYFLVGMGVAYAGHAIFSARQFFGSAPSLLAKSQA